MKLDILVLAAHPDDAELSCSGTMAAAVHQGKKVGIVDFTQGELGTRGTPGIRAQEAEKAASVLGLSIRENLGFRDGFFANDEAHQLALVRIIRKYQPDMVLANAIQDRHPDHAEAAALAEKACFLSGLKKITTFADDKPQMHWRPRRIFHYIQSNYIEPDFVVDITDFWDIKMRAVQAYQSQFFIADNPDSAAGEQTFISTPGFMEFLKARAREYGQRVGVQFAEGFTSYQTPLVRAIGDLL
jgi:bacillithiol biosynthesis deacetylase BshB1